MAKKRDSGNMRKRHAGMEITRYNRRRHVDDLMMRAVCNNVYAVDSEMAGVGYAYEDGHMAIVCTTGYIKMPIDNMKVMASEILGIIDDVKDLKTMGAQV